MRYEDAIRESICFAASISVCLTASRPAVNRIFVRHPPRTEKIITRQIDHAFAHHDGLGLPILEECFRSFFPKRQFMSSTHAQVIGCDASCLELFLQVRQTLRARNAPLTKPVTPGRSSDLNYGGHSFASAIRFSLHRLISSHLWKTRQWIHPGASR
jgi:hypothetical protein